MPGHDHADAYEVGQLARRLADGYLAHTACLLIARDPRAANLLPPVEADQRAPMRRLSTWDGSRYEFNLKHYLELAREDVIAAEFDRSFAAGALLALGDALAAHGYFDRAPELELVRHLRNAVAHGNRFEIRNPTELQTHPANTANAWGRSGPVLEVTPDSQGRVVLFDFLAPGDVIRVLQAVEHHLVIGPSGPPWEPGDD